jgi:hypothetical protein
MRANKERYRGLFFFTDLTPNRQPSGHSTVP